MKTKILITLIAVIFTGCIDNAIDNLNEVKKPAVVYAKFKPEGWYQNPQLSVIDAEGKLVAIRGEYLLQLIEKFNVGDTIK